MAILLKIINKQNPALNLSPQEIYQLAKNSFQASFLPPETKQSFIAELDRFIGNRSTSELKIRSLTELKINHLSSHAAIDNKSWLP